MISNRGAINPTAFAAEATLVNSHFLKEMMDVPPKEGMLAVGTSIIVPSHGKGKILGYNTSSSMFYGSDRYPYVCRFEDHFTEVYSREEITVVEE